MTSAVTASDNRALSLSGEWRFLSGAPELAAEPGPLPQLTFADTITLPGTTDTNYKGTPSTDRTTYSLSQPHRVEGTCWYQRQFTVPDAWRNKRIVLLLERSKLTQAWVDGQPIGRQAVYLTPQEYDLGNNLAPGDHCLTIAVDNKHLPPFGCDSHQFSENTQGNWNGILGRIELRATDSAWIDDVRLTPDAAARKLAVRIRIKSLAAGQGSLKLNATGEGIAPAAAATTAVQWSAGETLAEVTLPLGANAGLWDEFHPALHHLTIRLEAPGIADEHQLDFGLRNFTVAGRQFAINGRNTFLRGKHDACVFPLTGHTPMNVEEWLRYYRICQSYGINHVRFHSWTPPEAAFIAADQVGIYLQPELPFWGTFDQKAMDTWLPEAKRLLSLMGNHPSFVMFSLGNEHWSEAPVMDSLIAELRAYDPRLLYARGTNALSGQSHPGPNDDYIITADLKPIADGKCYRVRGANAGSNNPGHIQAGPANTLVDYSEPINLANFPVVSHEIGQFSVYPDFKEIAKYTGVCKPYNLEHFRDALAKTAMAHQNVDFARASGILAALCYREEIEAALRTPDFAGFELLDLQDFPGQGTALVGILDAFMDSKGILAPEQWRQFCAPVVLLARFSKYAWTQEETFTAEIQVAQYDQAPLAHATLAWSLKDAHNQVLRSGTLEAGDLACGGVHTLGKISAPLAGLSSPAQLRLELTLVGSSIANSYPLWVYPAQANTTPATGVTLARTFDAATRKTLAAGGRILLVCDSARPLARTVGGGFATEFWNFSFFHNKPGTMGLLCQNTSPALASFPTETHSNWQWHKLALTAQPLILDSLTPAEDQPIVQVIDNYDRCHKLGLIFEVNVGPGRLLICATDLVTLAPEHPEARQLLASLVAYTASEQFAPRTTLSMQAAANLLRVTLPTTGCTATASSFEDSWKNFTPPQLIDGNDSRGWQADPKAQGETWCQVAFPSPTDIGGCEILWDEPGYQYSILASTDGSTWHTLSDQRANSHTTARHDIPFTASAVSFVRIAIHATPGNRPAAVMEIRFFPSES